MDGRENNFLAAIHFGKGVCGVSFLDISTGEFMISEGNIEYVNRLLSDFQPKEVLYEKGRESMFLTSFNNKFATFKLDDWAFNETTARDRVLKLFRVRNLKGYGVEHIKAGVVAAGVILQYLEMTQHTQLGHITTISRIEEDKFVHMDPFTIRSLELLSTMNPDGKSLMDILDCTNTAMGARLLRRWTVFPLKDVDKINKRLDVVEALLRNPSIRDIIQEQLQYIGDIERIISRINTARVSPRELVALTSTLQAFQPIREAMEQSGEKSLNEIAERLDLCLELRQRLEKSIMPDAPALVAKGGVIAAGVDAQLDELRHIATGGKDYLIDMQQREAERTGIQSLKIGYNNVFGYYLEVRNTYKSMVPPEWIRKQTLVSAERYITEELKQYEEKIVGAEEKILALETRLFMDIVRWTAEFTRTLQEDATIIARLDCLVGFSISARARNYTRPTVDDGDAIDIKAGRHPVIEQLMATGERYIPNDVYLDKDNQQIMIITGPNMSGKSALLRQTALITLMAQMGSFVPAEKARIGYVDKIFTRVGASDNISLGESTFMVEMNEAASIINNLTPRSLVLFDELGRGTSTYDGISIAWSIVEYIHENKRSHPRTLFATHYHELNEMENIYSRIHNYNVSVLEQDGKIVFLRKLAKGGSEHSFGIHVAALAGMPRAIVNRSEVILRQLEEEKKHEELGNGQAAGARKAADKGDQLNFFRLDDPVLEDIRRQLVDIDINSLTPIDALNKLNEIKKLL